ncbi:hypothetical protein [Halomonas alkalisoli]|uniref:hypothetical protein n=1 Tax=Halomonas alkalisoli TaxID=2907158 RepID=UPI001F31DD0F|nr:hypothetical protein [Halomonas alkalisoli]MCE9684000.1 hypothetical protein [Halomonas alkalisoli]
MTIHSDHVGKGSMPLILFRHKKYSCFDITVWKRLMKEYLGLRLGLWSGYHHHKENMANAGFLIQMGLFSAIVTETVWPPSWVAEVTQLPRLWTFLVYFSLWYLIHYYTRWQLINKRLAAMYVTGFDQAYRRYMVDKDSVDITPCHDEASTPSLWKNFLSGLVYIPGGFTRIDASVEGLPIFIASEVQKQFQRGSGAQTLEILITYASIGLMILVGVKVFLGS